MSVELVREHARLAELAAEWEALADPLGDPLLRHDWFMAAALAFAPEGELRVTLVRDDAGLRATAPLVRDRAGGFARLRLLGHQLMEPQMLLHDNAAALRTACEAAMGEGLPLSLPRMAAGSEELDVLEAVARSRGVCVARPETTRTHANPLGPDWGAFERAMPPRKAAEIRRRRKRLGEEHGEVTFEALSPDENAAPGALAELLRVEAAGWKGREGTAILRDETMGRFINEYARRSARAGRLRMFHLRVAGEVAASHMMIESGGRLWGIKLGADERFHKFGVGVMVTHDVLRWASERGLQAVEHLGAAEAWQERWPLTVHRHSTFHFYPRTVSGAAALATDMLDFGQRRLRSRLAVHRRTGKRAPEDKAAVA